MTRNFSPSPLHGIDAVAAAGRREEGRVSLRSYGHGALMTRWPTMGGRPLGALVAVVLVGRRVCRREGDVVRQLDGIGGPGADPDATPRVPVQVGRGDRVVERADRAIRGDRRGAGVRPMTTGRATTPRGEERGERPSDIFMATPLEEVRRRIQHLRRNRRPLDFCRVSETPEPDRDYRYDLRLKNSKGAYAIWNCFHGGSPGPAGEPGAVVDRGRDHREEHRGAGRTGEDRSDPVAPENGEGRARRGTVLHRGGLRAASEAAGNDAQRDDDPGPDRRRGLRRAGGVVAVAVPGEARRAEGIGGRRARVRAGRGHRRTARPLAREGAPGRVPRDRGRGRHAGAQAARLAEGRRHEIHLPRSRLLPRDPRRDGRPRARGRADRRVGPRQLRAGRRRLAPVLGRVGAKGGPEECARDGGACRGERRRGRCDLQVPAGGDADRARRRRVRRGAGRLRFGARRPPRRARARPSSTRASSPASPPATSAPPR